MGRVGVMTLQKIKANIKLNELQPPDGAVAMNSQKLTGLAAGTAQNDSMRKGQAEVVLADMVPAVCSETEVVPIVEAAGLALATGKNIKVTSILTANDTWSGLSAILTAGEVEALGEAVYLKEADSEAYKALATAITTMPGVALATCATTDGNPFEFLLRGFMRHDAWNWTVGGLLYIDRTTAGALTQTPPATGGDQVQVVGIAITADIILFNPSYVLAEIA